MGGGYGSIGRAVVSTQEVCSLNPVDGKFILNMYRQLLWKDKNKEKNDREWTI